MGDNPMERNHRVLPFVLQRFAVPAIDSNTSSLLRVSRIFKTGGVDQAVKFILLVVNGNSLSTDPVNSFADRVDKFNIRVVTRPLAYPVVPGLNKFRSCFILGYVVNTIVCGDFPFS